MAVVEVEAQAHLVVVAAVAQVALLQALHHTKLHHHIQPLKHIHQVMLAAVLLLAVQLPHIALQLNRTKTMALFTEAQLRHHPLGPLQHQQLLELLIARALLTITDQDFCITTTHHG